MISCSLPDIISLIWTQAWNFPLHHTLSLLSYWVVLFLLCFFNQVCLPLTLEERLDQTPLALDCFFCGFIQCYLSCPANRKSIVRDGETNPKLASYPSFNVLVRRTDITPTGHFVMNTKYSNNRCFTNGSHLSTSWQWRCLSVISAVSVAMMTTKMDALVYGGDIVNEERDKKSRNWWRFMIYSV